MAIRRPVRFLLLLALATTPTVLRGGNLAGDLGRNDVRVRSAAYPLVAGRSVAQTALLERLTRLGYRRVHERPSHPGTFFYGHEVFWIYRKQHRLQGRDYPPSLIGLRLRGEDGMILSAVGLDGKAHELDRSGLLWLEPELLAESLDGGRADRVTIALADVPEHVWRAVLAAEDHRFFDHPGLDAKSILRAAAANMKDGRVSQGGSTITQQLIKNRDLRPDRTMGRKLSEAIRALMLEATYPKRDILEAYLNETYFGHVRGLAVHGIGTAARVYFSKPATRLELRESALLAAMIQAPNRLAPERHEQRARERRDRVLARMQELGWIGSDEAGSASAAGLGLDPSPPSRRASVQYLSWLRLKAIERAPKRMRSGKGVVVETGLDPYLQHLAENAVELRLKRLRADYPRLRRERLSAALIVLDVDTGDVLAHVGADPAATDDDFDRVRLAERQPGSAIKPLVMLQAFDTCGKRDPLNPSSRIADEPLRVDLPSGPWFPQNVDRDFAGIIDARTALAESRNVPLVRVALWCGLDVTAATLRKLGLELPQEPPASFVLGSVETTPLRLAAAYTVLAARGKRTRPRPVQRIEQPGGDGLVRIPVRKDPVTDAATAYLVRDLLRTAVESGTARVARIDGLDVAAKTGSTSGLRDAWLAGHAGPLVAVAWVGLDGGGSLGLSGAAAAGPIWRDFMSRAVPARPARDVEVPRRIVERYVDPRTGLLVRKTNRRGRLEIFRRDALPRRDRFWRSDEAVSVVR